MPFNQKILVTAFTMSFYGASIGMEQAKLELKQHAENISHYMAEENTEVRKQNILPFTEWLTAKRNSYSADEDWKTFCTDNHQMMKSILWMLPLYRFLERSKITPENMIDVIMARAYKLQPDASSQMVADTVDQDLLILYHACFKNKNF